MFPDAATLFEPLGVIDHLLEMEFPHILVFPVPRNRMVSLAPDCIGVVDEASGHAVQVLPSSTEYSSVPSQP